jgi:hypothetical protein
MDRIREVNEKEFWRIYPLIKNRGIEKIASILKENGYSVGRNVLSDEGKRFQNETYFPFSISPPKCYITDIIACKHIGKSLLVIEISLWSKTLYAWGNINSRTKDWFSTVIPFRDYSMDELVSCIRKSPKYQIWRYACLDRDFGKCQNEECGIDSKQSYLLAGKLLDVHHLKSLRNIIAENNLKCLDDAEKCAAIWDLDNGMTLCHICHRTITRFERLLVILQELPYKYHEDDINTLNHLRKLCVDKISLQRSFNKIMRIITPHLSRYYSQIKKEYNAEISL